MLLIKHTTDACYHVFVETEIVVEIGNSHEGSLGIAKSFIDMLLDIGVQTVKFQMHIPEYESSPEDEFRTKFSLQDNNRFDYWKRVQFSDESWKYISDFCQKNGIEFLCTPFSIEAATKLLNLTNLRRWKVGSGDAMNLPLIEFLSRTRKPLIISTGLVSWAEILELKDMLVDLGSWNQTTLLHCVSEYPTPLERSSLYMIDKLKTLGCKVGLSDHSGKLGPAIKALSMQVDLIEIHMTPNRLFFGPDTSSSLTLEEIKVLIQLRDEFNVMSSAHLTKEQLYDEAFRNRKLFRKAIYWSSNLEAGSVVELSDLSFLKPQLGIDAKLYKDVIGRRIVRNVKKGDLVVGSDLLDENK